MNITLHPKILETNIQEMSAQPECFGFLLKRSVKMNIDRKREARILAIVLALAILAFGSMQTTAWAAGTTYYVYCSDGSNGYGTQ